MICELFVTAYNEEFLLPKMIDFYRARIPDIIINVYDNRSTDRTAAIAREMGCIVHDWDTNGEIRDDLLLEWKNNVWKTSKATWIIVIDMDEWVNVWPWMLITPNTYYCCEGYNMVTKTRGLRYPMEDKLCVFPASMKETNYGPGAHTSNTVTEGKLSYSTHHPILYHMKYAFGVERVIERYKECALRLSQFNKDTGYGFHYTFDEAKIREEYEYHLNHSIKV